MLCSVIILIALLIIFRYLINDWQTIVEIMKSLRSSNVDLKQRYGDWAAITGASDGIGKAYADQLAKRKINIALIGRNYEKLQNVAIDLKGRHGIETKIIIADFSQGRKIYDKLKNDLNSINIGILVNNVGIQYEYPMAFADLPENEIWDNVHVNITSATMMTRIILPKMLENNKGAIVNISSAASLQPQPYMNLYAASKSYIFFFSEALRQEVKTTNITIQTLTPFYVSSKINHFVDALQKVDFFIPDVETYAYHAVNTLGKISWTTGYWPHRLEWFGVNLLPMWYRTMIVLLRYRSYGRKYLKKINTK